MSFLAKVMPKNLEYPNLPERKLIDVPANSRASQGTYIQFTKNISYKYTQHDGRNTDNHDTMVVVAHRVFFYSECFYRVINT